MLEFLNILPFTKEVDRKFGQPIAELYKKGTTIGEMDTSIAAFTLEFDQIIVTRNIKHFEKIEMNIESF